MYRHASCVWQSVGAVFGGSLVTMRALLAQIVGVRFCRVAAARFNPVWAGAKGLVMSSGVCTNRKTPISPLRWQGAVPVRTESRHGAGKQS
jgi:hypothetical protein